MACFEAANDCLKKRKHIRKESRIFGPTWLWVVKKKVVKIKDVNNGDNCFKTFDHY